jgi:hypothetical protein
MLGFAIGILMGSAIGYFVTRACVDRIIINSIIEAERMKVRRGAEQLPPASSGSAFHNCFGEGALPCR